MEKAPLEGLGGGGGGGVGASTTSSSSGSKVVVAVSHCNTFFLTYITGT